MKTPSGLFGKYDVPAPRYTSYPTVPYWEGKPTEEEWIGSLRNALAASDSSWSLYLHVPFCETLCTFCGCNTVITRNHDVENPYVSRLLAEWEMYLARVPALGERTLQHLHLGGGTPTFLEPRELERLLDGILSRVRRSTGDGEAEFEGSIEVDPRRTTEEQLRLLRTKGFTRLSLGVQDFDPEVQRLVNRLQPYEITERIVAWGRALGYSSVNFDLIYGLPKQTVDGFRDTIRKTIVLRPDRIALYSFALVPWIKKVQRIFKDEDLPRGEEKRRIYEVARDELLGAGYVEIGMDHFALPTEALARALAAKTLHRNFMGYTDRRTEVLLGIGLSSISETPDCFHQNEKVLPVYERLLDQGALPSHRGHRLTAEDRAHREQILRLMTEYEVRFRDEEQERDIRAFLAEPIADGLVEIESGTLRMTDLGRPFLRNVAMAFDRRLRLKSPETRTFSQAV